MAGDELVSSANPSDMLSELAGTEEENRLRSWATTKLPGAGTLRAQGVLRWLSQAKRLQET